MNKRKQLLRNGLGVIAVKLLGSFLAFVLSVILARSLGADGYGLYTFVFSILMLLSIPVQGGMPNLAVRETSKAFACNDWLTIGGILLWVRSLNIAYFIFLIVLMSLFSYISDDWIGTKRYELFLVGFVLVPILALTVTQSAILRGLGRVVVGSALEGVGRFAVTLILICLAMMFIPDYQLTPFYTMIISVFSVFIVYLASLYYLQQQVKGRIPNMKGTRLDSVSWRNALYPLTVIGGVQLLFGYADSFILGIFQSDQELGIYRVAVQISTLVVFGLSALNQMLQPYFSRLYAEGNMVELQRLVSFSSKIILFLSVFPSVVFLIFGEVIITYIFGQEFSIGKNALSILIVGNLFNAAFGSVGALLNMTGHEKDSMRGMIIALMVNIVLDVLLIPYFGMEGAAIATAVSMVVWNVILRRYVKLRLGIESAGFIPAKKAI